MSSDPVVPTKKKEETEEELSEEDQQLKTNLDTLVERLLESDSALYAAALTQLKEYIRNSTSSMTAVPKPLKFLRPFYPELKERYPEWKDAKLKSQLADVLSVLAMTYDDGKYDSLRFRTLSQEPSFELWGHEHVRHLALEIGEVFSQQVEDESLMSIDTEQLVQLGLQIVPFFLKHNAEADAIDLLLEIESIDQLPQFVDKDTFARVCMYLVSCVPFLSPPDDSAFLKTAYNIYLSNDALTEALAIAIRLDDDSLIQAVFDATDSLPLKKQLAYILAVQRSAFRSDNDDIQEIIGNVKLSEHFQYLTKELNLTAPKTPEDIYKSHLENSRALTTGMDSAKQNLASSFVNALVNMGYCSDKLVLQDNSWVYKTKGDGMLSTVASIGSIYQWNTDGLQEVDKYLYGTEEEVQAGALLAMGLAGSGVHEAEIEPVLLVLQDYISNPSKKLAISSILGLGISFAGSQNEELLALLLPVASDSSLPLEVTAVAALTLGHAFVGTCHGDITAAILENLLEREEADLKNKWTKFVTLALGLLYIGKGEQVDDVLETISALEHPIAKSLEVLVKVCAYAGTGNVLLIQDLLHTLTPKNKKKDEEEDDEEEEEDEVVEKVEGDVTEGVTEAIVPETKQESEEKDEEKEKDEEDEEAVQDELSFAVLGIAIIAMGEEIGKEMSLRHFAHLMHYGNEAIRRTVPLAMGLVSVSNPQMKVFDTLSRFSHDQDIQISINSILSMGLVGAGTNNARLAQLLRHLAAYYSKEQNALFTTRIAQGLVHLGKGTMTLGLFNDARVLNKVTLASLLTVLVGFTTPLFMLEHHYLLYFLNAGARPKFVLTLNEEGEPIKVNVRVGQAVDTVGQAGKPKRITGWVTHSTPVLLGHNERCELEDDEYISLASSIEGVVILQKNPDFEKAV